MRIFLFILFFMPGEVSNAKNHIAELRTLYYCAPSDKEAADKFFRATEAIKPEAEPLLQCYKGMALMMKANYTINPYSKLSYFNKGKVLVAKAVKRDPKNIEIRFMRFCAQTNAPAFLGYNDEIIVDKKTILTSWHTIEDSDLKDKIRTYLAESKYCTNDEKSVLL